LKNQLPQFDEIHEYKHPRSSMNSKKDKFKEAQIQTNYNLSKDKEKFERNKRGDLSHTKDTQ